MDVGKIRVASWNIWVFGKRDFKGIAKLIRKNKIDIIGIQEAAVYQGKPRKLDIVREIAKELGYFYIFSPVRDARPKYNWIYGNAIISKFPILNAKTYNLNPPYIKYDGTFMTEQRKVVHSKIKLGKNKKIDFLTAHFQYSERFESNPIKKLEFDTLISLVSKLSAPVILTGDFNSTPEVKDIRRLGKILKRIGGNEPTWTIYPFEAYEWHEDRLKYRIDNIFISKNLSYSNFKVIRSKISDHLPIKADILLE